MRNTIAIAALCLGIFAAATLASAGDMNTDNLKDCFKDPSSSKCTKNFDEARKALEDISKGRKPTIALPVDPSALLKGDLAKLFAD
jgi:hypothetical protein